MEQITGINDLSDFPVSEYLRKSIINARTISRRGAWWTACLAIKDPKGDKVHIAIYKWQKRNNQWKQAQKIKINSQKDLDKIVEALKELKNTI